MLDYMNPFESKMWTEHVADFLSMGYELNDAMKLADDVYGAPLGVVHPLCQWGDDAQPEGGITGERRQLESPSGDGGGGVEGHASASRGAGSSTATGLKTGLCRSTRKTLSRYQARPAPAISRRT